MAFEDETMQAVNRRGLQIADAPTAATESRTQPKWKWLKRILLGTVVFALSGWVTGALLLRSWTAKPPAIPTNASILQLKAQEHDGKVWLGQSWVGRREGLLTVYLKGNPFELGYANGVLLQPQIHTLENEFIKMVQGYVPNAWVLRALKWYVVYRNRHLTDYIAADYR